MSGTHSDTQRRGTPHTADHVTTPQRHEQLHRASPAALIAAVTLMFVVIQDKKTPKDVIGAKLNMLSLLSKRCKVIEHQLKCAVVRTHLPVV